MRLKFSMLRHPLCRVETVPNDVRGVRRLAVTAVAVAVAVVVAARLFVVAATTAEEVALALAGRPLSDGS